jgi:hypothetical protein
MDDKMKNHRVEFHGILYLRIYAELLSFLFIIIIVVVVVAVVIIYRQKYL